MALKPIGGKYEGVWVNELKNGDISYYINYRDENSKPVKVQVGKKTKNSDFTARDAYAKLIEIKYKLQHDQEPILKASRVKKIKFDDIWEKFKKHAVANKKSYQMDIWNYEKHIQPVFGNKVVKNLKPIDFENFKQDLISKKLSAQTVKHQLTLARTIMNYAIKHEILKNFTNPISNGKVKMPEIDNQRQAFLTKSQAKELLEILKTLDLQTYHLTVLLLFTGARFSEITGASSQKNKNNTESGIRWSDVNFDTNTIYFKKTKNGNARHIFINDILLETLQYLQKHKKSNLVISTKTGGTILKMPNHFMTAVESVIPGNKNKDAQNKITAHSLRHTHASWLAMAGLDILQIKEQLGHKTLEMTLRYSHLIPNKRHKVTKELFL
jgi:integrase